MLTSDATERVSLVLNCMAWGTSCIGCPAVAHPPRLVPATVGPLSFAYCKINRTRMPRNSGGCNERLGLLMQGHLPEQANEDQIHSFSNLDAGRIFCINDQPFQFDVLGSNVWKHDAV